MKNQKLTNLKYGELFAGYGGLGRAIEEVFGAEPAWFAENEPAPSTVLHYHYPDVPNLGDVTKVDWNQVKKVDIISGGSPCQDISTAGGRAGMQEGTRSNLWAAFREAIKIIQPQWVVWENVRGAYSARATSDMEPCPGCMGNKPEEPSLRALGRVLGDLANLGYDAQWTGIRASDIGACHQRYRVFLLANLTNPDGTRPPIRFHDHPSQRETALPESARTPGINNLLPTPVAQPSHNTPENHLRKKPGRKHVTDLNILVNHGLLNDRDLLKPGSAKSMSSPVPFLFPTPRATEGGSANETVDMLPTPLARLGDSRGPQNPAHRKTAGHSVGLDEVAAFELLPTPTATDGIMGTPTTTVRPSDKATHLATRLAKRTNWGRYHSAIRRHEHFIGRPAPKPTTPSPRSERPQLSAEFVEWMMGLPHGWVTNPRIWEPTNLSPSALRKEQLKMLGNGVVPQQAIEALHRLTANFYLP